MRTIIPRKVFFLPNELADKEHACMSESQDTFHWSLDLYAGAYTFLVLLLVMRACNFQDMWIWKPGLQLVSLKEGKRGGGLWKEGRSALFPFPRYLPRPALFVSATQAITTSRTAGYVSDFKVANTFQEIVLYNDLKHMRRIWGWLYLEKCFFFTKWACRQRTCMCKRITRDISPIFK